ncbi:hypothetical protein B0J18DRAFT_479044 [Chaetomium sp. MPI-SDFR-AT-0129]|nr:hypothetical protein B0J18DRAFT_479044 [Chaetomium sp. MPI-SDFR-AT-0129]
MASSSSVQGQPSPGQVVEAAIAVARSLGDEFPYAIVGGAACLVLGSHRLTTDESFIVESRTNHTHYRSTPPVGTDILTPPALFKGQFDESTETIRVNGTRVLKPTLILNAKCYSILGRATAEKKDRDADDISFLPEWCIGKAVYPTNSEVPNATKEFVDQYIAKYGRADVWNNAGYDISGGTWTRD